MEICRRDVLGVADCRARTANARQPAVLMVIIISTSINRIRARRRAATSGAALTQALITQMSQTAECNRLHTVEQQLCRWLLLSLDRLSSNELTMTQELIANMLGVRRGGVTETAGRLQAAGLIHYSRGHITVLDRPRLEAWVCECYAVVKKEMDRLLPDATAS